MRAAIVTSRGKLELAQRPTPAPGAGELLLKVETCGLCHSDLHAIDGDWTPAPTLPLIPGHEVIGLVAEVGAGVSPDLVGRRFGVAWHAGSCGVCAWCRSGFETVCPEAEMTGYTRDGGFADYLTARADHAIELSADVDPLTMAPVLCAGVTPFRGLNRGGVVAGDWVVVSGAGGLGHLAIQYAVARGARVIAIDPSPERRSLAAELGAEQVFSSDATSLVQYIADLTGGGPQVVLVTATAPGAFEVAIDIVRPGGAVVFIGLPGGDSDRIRVSISAVSNWEKSIIGSNVGSRADLRGAVDLSIAKGIRAHVSAVAYDALPQALEALRRGEVSGRLVLDMRPPGP